MLNESFFNAYIAVIIFILIGVILEKKKLFTDSVKKFLTFFVLTFCIPSLAFKPFMVDFNYDSLVNNGIIIVLSFIIYIILLLISTLVFIKYKNRAIYGIFCSIGLVTMFSIPIIETMFDKEALITANLLTLSFRFFLYVYAFMVIAKKQTSKKDMIKNLFLNPVVIAMILGLFIWLSQGWFFKVNINNESISILRIDKTLPYLYSTIKTLSSMTVYMCMILVGGIIGKQSIINALKNKLAIVISLMRALITPLIVLGFLLLVNMLPFINLSSIDISVTVISFVAPLSAVINTFAIRYENEDVLAANVSLLSTLICIITMPLICYIVSLI